MKITIITAHFQPELHPRAFRSTELALEFSKMGHQVEVVTFRTIIGFDYQNYAKLNNIKIKCLNIYKVNSIHENISDNKKLNKQSRFLIDYLIAGNLFNYSFKVKNIYNIPKNTDLVISISTPFMSLLSTALLRYKNKSPNTKDPNLDIELEFDNNFKCFINALDLSNYGICELDIFGTKGRLKINLITNETEYRIESQMMEQIISSNLKND